jgi:predicted Zn-dependent protease with MMP-like domain
MTIIPWPKNVQRKGALTIAADESFKGGHWNTALDKAIATFNQLMSDNGIKVTISKAEKEINAHIRFETEKGNGIHGNGVLTTTKMGGNEYLDRIVIKVPATPRISNDAKSREVGVGVRIYILVHEMIHAIGLTNDEHSKDDVFTKAAVLKPGKTAGDDQVQPMDGSEPMPAIRLGATTIANLKKAWPGPE